MDDAGGDPRTRAREDYAVIRPVPLRWADVDVFGHVNNAVHYSLMDTAICGWLQEELGTQISSLDALSVVVETGCRYFHELHFPSALEIGIRVQRVGTSSVQYELGFFVEDRPVIAVAKFVHVYIDPLTRAPSRIPAEVRALLDTTLSR
ncbi:MAG: acyl-CoA thioesterase [Leucobacter sp.]